MISFFNSVPLFKYPRTPHLYDAGGSAITRSDLLLDDKDVRARYMAKHVVCVEEKVDGLAFQ
jgi:hypothetical protein